MRINLLRLGFIRKKKKTSGTSATHVALLANIGENLKDTSISFNSATPNGDELKRELK